MTVSNTGATHVANCSHCRTRASLMLLVPAGILLPIQVKMAAVRGSVNSNWFWNDRGSKVQALMMREHQQSAWQDLLKRQSNINIRWRDIKQWHNEKQTAHQSNMSVLNKIWGSCLKDLNKCIWDGEQRWTVKLQPKLSPRCLTAWFS